MQVKASIKIHRKLNHKSLKKKKFGVKSSLCTKAIKMHILKRSTTGMYTYMHMNALSVSKIWYRKKKEELKTAR